MIDAKDVTLPMARAALLEAVETRGREFVY